MNCYELRLLNMPLELCSSWRTMLLSLEETVNPFTDRFKSLHKTPFVHEKVRQSLLVKTHTMDHNQH